MDTFAPGDLVIIKQEMSQTSRAFIDHHGVGLVTKVGPAHPHTVPLYCGVVFSKSGVRMEFLARDLQKVNNTLDLPPTVLRFEEQEGEPHE